MGSFTGKVQQFNTIGRYGMPNGKEGLPSVCSSSLSPLRSSAIQMDHSARRNDFLNRSAIIGGQGISNAAQNMHQ